MGKKKNSKLKKARLLAIQQNGPEILGKAYEECCEKYKKSEKKRCDKCPCFDLIKKMA
tara:strand:- start:993 stop:1166 length:174 start_codon:yes stop_codon:yes gene_type:complete